MQENQSNQSQNPLGVMPISKLLPKYAVPSVISMLVTAIYNIVDQIFIGRGVGYLGNTATTVVFPLMTVGLSMALLVGNGSAAFISLELGKGNSDKARKTLGNALALITVAGVCLTAAVLLFQRPVLTLLGATDAIMPHAINYSTFIMIGMPFNMITTAVANMIRADGSPRYSMFATMTGAVLNTILDPIFIFVFDMGVQGAAIATAISQVVSCLLALLYVFRYAKYIRFEPTNLKVDWKLAGAFTALGSFSFINQLSITVLNIVMNNSFRHYGAMSVYGSEIPLAAIGIVMKINSILISTILGVVIGAQPILGFNYGARNFARVIKTFKTVICITLTLSSLCWLLFMLTPETFIGIFGDRDSDFFVFACMALRTFLGGVFLAGLQIPSASYFQAVGKPTKAMVLTLSRQIIFIIPSILILPIFFGVEGILYAGPVGDILSILITGFIILKEMRGLKQEMGGGSAAVV